jgi:RHS repeat-associated protein
MKNINGEATRFLYDGLDVAQEVASGLPINSLRSMNIDELLVRGSAQHYLTDALGSTIAVTDESGGVQIEYAYEPFGQGNSDSSVYGNYQYTGRENDGQLYYYRARYYAPSLHRFITEDPVGFASGPNLYKYAANNPTRYSDPLGLREYEQARRIRDEIVALNSQRQAVDAADEFRKIVGFAGAVNAVVRTVTSVLQPEAALGLFVLGRAVGEARGRAVGLGADATRSVIEARQRQLMQQLFSSGAVGEAITGSPSIRSRSNEEMLQIGSGFGEFARRHPEFIVEYEVGRTGDVNFRIQGRK